MGTIGLGMVGAGRATQASAPAFAAHPGLHIVGVAEPDAEIRRAFARDHGVPGFDDLAGLLTAPEVDAVYIATPTPLHASQAISALEAGRHVIVEKPMATTLADAIAMVDAAAAANRVLLVGHSHSFDLPIRRMRALIDEERLGRVRMVNTWCFSDWVYRPRRPDELDPGQGGSVLFRQGAHQFDIVRLLAGGEATHVQAQCFDMDPARPTLGAHMAMLGFANGAAASVVYNGYGGLPGAALCGGVGEWGFPATAGTAAPRHPAGHDETHAKRARAVRDGNGPAPFQPHFGLTIVSCERGDIRQSPTGLLLHGPEGQEEIELDTSQTPHTLVAAEFHDAVHGIRPALHNGRWGLANLEVCDAAWRSARTGERVALRHQVPVPPIIPVPIPGRAQVPA